MESRTELEKAIKIEREIVNYSNIKAEELMEKLQSEEREDERKQIKLEKKNWQMSKYNAQARIRDYEQRLESLQ